MKLIVAMLFAAFAHGQSPTVELRVRNTLPIAREAETVSLGWQNVLRDLPAAAPGRIRVVDPLSEQELTTQLLDANADGRPDSLLFQVTLQPNETRLLSLQAVAPTAKTNALVHVKFVPEREDVAWESDRIAFRTYGKKLWELENLHTNGIDVWPKRARKLVLDAWYAKGHDGYHVDVGEGADFYQVGTTLGTGGTGIWRNETLYRGDNFLTHRILADGPIRAIFEVDYGTVDAGGLKITETKRVSIDGGQYFFRQESRFSGHTSGELQIAIGLVKRPNAVGSHSKDRAWGWLTLWGPIEPRTRGHGDLGTAVLMSKQQLVDLREVDNHYLAIGKIQPGQTLVNYVGAGWTSSRDFEDVEDWWTTVDNFAQRLATPIVLTVHK